MLAGYSPIHSPLTPGPRLNVVCTGPATGTVVPLAVSDGPMTVSVAPFDVPPPGAGVTTVIVAVPPLAISLARIVAVSDVALPTVVARGLPFTCTTDVPTKFVPVTVNANAAPPAVTVAGLIIVSVGAGGGGVMLSVTPFDVHALFTHAVGFSTVIVWLVPAVVASLAASAAVTVVAVPKVVGRVLPSTRTVAPDTNPVPVTVNVNAALPAARLAGLIPVTVGVGLITANVTVGLCASTVPLALIHRN